MKHQKSQGLIVINILVRNLIAKVIPPWRITHWRRGRKFRPVIALDPMGQRGQ